MCAGIREDGNLAYSSACDTEHPVTFISAALRGGLFVPSYPGAEAATLTVDHQGRFRLGSPCVHAVFAFGGLSSRELAF
jgi:hypothetical protein